MNTHEHELNAALTALKFLERDATFPNEALADLMLRAKDAIKDMMEYVKGNKPRDITDKLIEAIEGGEK